MLGITVVYSLKSSSQVIREVSWGGGGFVYCRLFDASDPSPSIRLPTAMPAANVRRERERKLTNGSRRIIIDRRAFEGRGTSAPE